jgi:hypothetical protein
MSCSKRGGAASCTYSNGNQNRRHKHDGGSRASEAQLRLHKLEEMVTTLIQATKGGPESRSEETFSSSHNVPADQRFKDLSVHHSPHICLTSLGGHLDINGSEANYVGATHWATILENVSTLYVSRGSPYVTDMP